MVEFYYYRDRDGKEWGPFSNGQLTGLLNRGVLSNRSQLRPEAEQELYLYYYRPIDRSLLFETPTEEDERKMRRGGRVSHALELHVAWREIEKEEGATPQSPPLDFDRDFAANELALVYAGFEIRPVKPRSLLRLNYHGTGGTEATILLSEDLEFYDWFANEQDVFEVFARAVRAHAAEAEAGVKRFAKCWKPRWLETKGKTGCVRHASMRITWRDEVRVTAIEYLTVTVLRRFSFELQFIYPKYREYFEQDRMRRFLTLGIDAVSSSKKSRKASL